MGSSLTTGLKFAVHYLSASWRRDSARALKLAVATVAVSVGFIAIIASVIAIVPLIFMKMAEAEVSEADLLLVPDPGGVLVRGPPT